ncbi:hypothetical protein ACFFQF_21810 [Haladaptatus pallidirubidus]
MEHEDMMMMSNFEVR